MFIQLTIGERAALDLIKKEYDGAKSNSLASIQPKLQIDVKEDVMVSLQNKGFWVVERKDLGDNMEMVSITLKEEFFKYYNILV